MKKKFLIPESLLIEGLTICVSDHIKSVVVVVVVVVIIIIIVVVANIVFHCLLVL